jgi:hypothetical protein
MSNLKGSKNIITISDPELLPYVIGKDTAHGGYIVYQQVTTSNTKDKQEREYVKTVCYPNSIQNALKAIIREKIKDDGKTEYTSLKEYLYRWEEISKSIANLVPNVE